MTSKAGRILGIPGADSGGEGKTKRVNKNRRGQLAGEDEGSCSPILFRPPWPSLVLFSVVPNSSWILTIEDLEKFDWRNRSQGNSSVYRIPIPNVRYDKRETNPLCIHWLLVTAKPVFLVFLDAVDSVIRIGYEETRWTFPDQRTERIMERDQDTKEERKVTEVTYS